MVHTINLNNTSLSWPFILPCLILSGSLLVLLGVESGSLYFILVCPLILFQAWNSNRDTFRKKKYSKYYSPFGWGQLRIDFWQELSVVAMRKAHSICQTCPGAGWLRNRHPPHPTSFQMPCFYISLWMKLQSWKRKRKIGREILILLRKKLEWT